MDYYGHGFFRKSGMVASMGSCKYGIEFWLTLQVCTKPSSILLRRKTGGCLGRGWGCRGWMRWRGRGSGGGSGREERVCGRRWYEWLLSLLVQVSRKYLLPVCNNCRKPSVKRTIGDHLPSTSMINSLTVIRPLSVAACQSFLWFDHSSEGSIYIVMVSHPRITSAQM